MRKGKEKICEKLVLNLTFRSSQSSGRVLES